MAKRRKLVIESVNVLTKLRDEYEIEARKPTDRKPEDGTSPLNVVRACNAALTVLIRVEVEDNNTQS